MKREIDGQETDITVERVTDRRHCNDISGKSGRCKKTAKWKLSFECGWGRHRKSRVKCYCETHAGQELTRRLCEKCERCGAVKRWSILSDGTLAAECECTDQLNATLGREIAQVLQ